LADVFRRAPLRVDVEVGITRGGDDLLVSEQFADDGQPETTGHTERSVRVS